MLRVHTRSGEGTAARSEPGQKGVIVPLAAAEEIAALLQRAVQQGPQRQWWEMEPTEP